MEGVNFKKWPFFGSVNSNFWARKFRCRANGSILRDFDLPAAHSHMGQPRAASPEAKHNENAQHKKLHIPIMGPFCPAILEGNLGDFCGQSSTRGGGGPDGPKTEILEATKGSKNHDYWVLRAISHPL